MRRFAPALLALLALSCRSTLLPTAAALPTEISAVSISRTLRDVRVIQRDGAIEVSAKSDPRFLAELGRTWTFEILGYYEFGGSYIHVGGPGQTRTIYPDVGPGETRTSTRYQLATWGSEFWVDYSILDIHGAKITVTIPSSTRMVRAFTLATLGGVPSGPLGQLFLLEETHGHGLDDPEFPAAEEPVAMKRQP